MRLAASLRPGELGKTEAWVILSAEPDARIYAGLRPGTTPAELRRHLARARSPSVCTRSFPGRATVCFCRQAPSTASAAEC